jgi:hypothetical protein
MSMAVATRPKSVWGRTGRGVVQSRQLQLRPLFLHRGQSHFRIPLLLSRSTGVGPPAIAPPTVDIRKH